MSTLGVGDRSVNRPSLGNGFDLRFREDLALFAELGVTEVRLAVDWARLQPSQGVNDSDWREWYQDVLVAAAGHGIGVWLSLLEAPLPRWFDDEGGFGDAKAAGRWWPRWVETCTELFGDQPGLAGWFPIHDPIGVAANGVEDGSPRHLDSLANVLVAWRDAWRILKGGPPVASSLGLRIVRAADESVPAKQIARREDHLRWTLWLRALRDGTVSIPTRSDRALDDLAGSLDVLGFALGTDATGIDRVTDATIGPWEDRAGTLLRRVAEDGPNRPISVTYRARLTDDDQRGVVAGAFGRALAGAQVDGIPLQHVFWSPAIDGPNDTTGPISIDRDVKGSAEAWPSIEIATVTEADADAADAEAQPRLR